MKRSLIAIVFAVLTVVGCDGTPIQPAVTPPPAATVSLSGLVSEAGTSLPIPFARVDVISGVNLGHATNADSAGRYRLDNLSPGGLTVRATAPGYLAWLDIVALDADRVLDFAIARAPFVTTARVVDALSDAPLDGVAVSGNITPAWSDADGRFTAAVLAAATDPLSVSLMRQSYVTRNTMLLVPGPAVDLAMIPNTFDLRSFDELCRTPVLRRWTTAPALIVQMRYLRFTSAEQPEFEALSAAMTDEEVDQLIADLSGTLPRLTGGTFTAFSSIRRDLASTGTQVGILNPGAITFARFSGLTALNPEASAYGRWLTDDTSAVIGGAMLMDSTTDAREPQRVIIRMHEMGHALGYDHVTATSSIMNPRNAPPPTFFDLLATKVAFQRKPGNTSPDVDPEPAVHITAKIAARWSLPVR